MRKIWGLFFSLTILGFLVGVGVGLFQLFASWIVNWSHAFYTFFKDSPIYVIIGSLLLGLVAYRIGHKVPSAKGSGIPYLAYELGEHHRFRYWRALPFMLLNCMISFFGALPLGSEGPSVFAGGIFGMALNDLNQEKNEQLITMGAAAGFGSAFLSPLAGWVYYFEVSLKRFSWRFAVQMAYVAILSWGIASLIAPPLHFSFSLSSPIVWEEIFLLLAIVLSSLLLGHFFPWLLLKVRDWKTKHLGKRGKFISIIAIFLCGGIVAIYFPSIAGAGTAVFTLFEAMPGIGILLLLGLFRLAYIVLAANSGAAGGLVFPMFSIGLFSGLIILDVAMSWFGYGGEQASLLLLLSMVGMYAVVTKSPWTATALTFTFLPSWHTIIPTLLVMILIARLDKKTHNPCLNDELKFRIAVEEKQNN